MAADTVVLEVSIFLVADDPVRAGCFLRVCFFLLLLAKSLFSVINWDPFTPVDGE